MIPMAQPEPEVAAAPEVAEPSPVFALAATVRARPPIKYEGTPFILKSGKPHRGPQHLNLKAFDLDL